MSEASKLKGRARAAYVAYHSITDGYPCGNALAQHISPKAHKAARIYDESMTRLREIDPSCPEFRPLSARQ